MIGKGVRFGYILNSPARGDIAVACPSCGREAVFTSPYDFLEALDKAPEELIATHVRVVKWSGGVAIERFPDIFPWRDPNNPYIHMVRDEIWGVLSCHHCPHREKHLLDWPADTFYLVEFPYGTLWAYTREHLLEIRQFVSGSTVERGRFDMTRVPKDFLLKRNRMKVVQRIDAVLLGSA